MQIDATGLGNLLPFFVALVLAKQHTLGHVTVGLPPIGRMGLSYVHHQERNPVLVPVVDLFNAPNLSAERGSSIAAKDQTHRLLATVA